MLLKERDFYLCILLDNLKIIQWGDLTDFHMVINATSLGLNNETINLDFSSLGHEKLFYGKINFITLSNVNKRLASKKFVFLEYFI